MATTFTSISMIKVIRLFDLMQTKFTRRQLLRLLTAAGLGAPYAGRVMAESAMIAKQVAPPTVILDTNMLTDCDDAAMAALMEELMTRPPRLSHP
jgi:hypothetical protein